MSILAPNSHMIYRGEGYQSENQNQIRTGIGCGSALTKPYAFGCGRGDWKKKKKQQLMPERRGLIRVNAVWPDSRHDIVEMQPITDCEHLDQILEHAKQLSQPILIDWKAAWCRKCIYLKPKLEKLAAEYDTKMKFYCVDVNNVPQALVKRGNISKMPTIQLWKDGVMKEEVIGGHKAWLVIDEVRAMIQKFV